MTPGEPGDELDTSAADEAIRNQKVARGRIAALMRLVDAAMTAPEGEQWEQEVSAPETEEAEGPRPKSSAQADREREWRRQFEENWFKPPRPK